MTQEGRLIDLRRLTERCVRAHPTVTTDPAKTHGVPYVRGTSLSVCEILGRLFVHGKVSSVEGIYSDITEEQVKEVVLFASTFIETAYELGRDD